MAKMHDVTQVHGTVVDVADDLTNIATGRVKLWGVYINTTLSAHDLRIEAGSDGTGTEIITIPASTAAGAMFDIPGAVFFGLTVDPDNAAAGNITVMWSEV